MLDRSNAASGTLSKSARCINEFLQAYGMVDVWKYKNPTSRQYSFFSAAHQVYSRIDFIFIDKRMLPLLRTCEYTGIVISDHSPVLMTLCFPDNMPSQGMWRFNSGLLADEKFVDFLSNQIDYFFETNCTPGMTYCNLWETMKAFLRGQIISYSAGMRKIKMERINQIISRINDIDQEHSRSPTTALYKERGIL